MNTIDSNDTPKRRLEDHQPAATINWAEPGAPAVPATPDSHRATPLRAVASMSVNADGVSVFPTPAAKGLAHGHYMLSVPSAHMQPDAAPVRHSAATSGAALADLQQLKALALAATPGPWSATHWNGHTPTTVMRSGDVMVIAETTGFGRDSVECAKDAAFIAAANPAVVLDLFARIGHLNEALKLANDCLAGRPAASPVAPEQDQAIAESKIASTDDARRFVCDWHLKHFPTDRTFSRYIMADPARSNPLAGDFAWQLAKALEAMAATPAAHIASKPNPEPTGDAARFERMFMAACADLGMVSEELGLDPDDGGADPIIEAIRELKSDAATPAASAPTVPEGQTLIGKLLDDFSNIEHLWGLNEPGALVRHRDVFNLIVAAGKAFAAAPVAHSASADAVIEAKAEPEPEECWSRDQEDFNHLSLGDLIGTHEDLKPGDTVWVGEAVHPNAAQMVNVDLILENIGEAAYDIGGEHAEDYPDVTDEQSKELELLVADWLNRSCNATFWTVTNVKPYVLSAGDFGTQAAGAEGAAS